MTMGTLSRRNRKISFTPLSAGYGRAVRRFGLGAELHRAYVRRHTRQSTRLKALRLTDPYKAADDETKKRLEDDVLAKCAAEYSDDVDEVQHEWRVRQSERGRDVGFIGKLRLRAGWGVHKEIEDHVPGPDVDAVSGGDAAEQAKNFKPDLPVRRTHPDKESTQFYFYPAFPDLQPHEPEEEEEGTPSAAAAGDDAAPAQPDVPSEKKQRKRRAGTTSTPAPKKSKKGRKSGGGGGAAEWEQYTTVISAPATPEQPPRPSSSSPLSSAPASPASESVVSEQPSAGADPGSSHRRRGPKPSTTPGEDPSKTFACTICHSRFRRREHLKRHMTTLHTAEKPFVCGECGKKCSREDNLTQHFKTRHMGGERNDGAGEDEDMEYSDDDDDYEGSGQPLGEDGQRYGELEVRESPQQKKEVDWEQEGWMTLKILREAAAAVDAQEREHASAMQSGEGGSGETDQQEPDVNGERLSFLGAAGGEPPRNLENTDPRELLVVLKYPKSPGDGVEAGVPEEMHHGLDGIGDRQNMLPGEAVVKQEGGLGELARAGAAAQYQPARGVVDLTADDYDRAQDASVKASLAHRSHSGSSSRVDNSPFPAQQTVSTDPENQGALSSDTNDDRRFKCRVIGCPNAYKNSNGLKYHRVHGHKNQDLHENPDGSISILNAATHSMDKVKPYICDHCGKRYKNLNGLKYHKAHSTHAGPVSRDPPVVPLAPRPHSLSVNVGTVPNAFSSGYPAPAGSPWQAIFMPSRRDGSREESDSDLTELQEDISTGDETPAVSNDGVSVPLRGDTDGRGRYAPATLSTPKRVPPRSVFLSPKGSPEPGNELETSIALRNGPSSTIFPPHPPNNFIQNGISAVNGRAESQQPSPRTIERLREADEVRRRVLEDGRPLSEDIAIREGRSAGRPIEAPVSAPPMSTHPSARPYVNGDDQLQAFEALPPARETMQLPPLVQRYLNEARQPYGQFHRTPPSAPVEHSTSSDVIMTDASPLARAASPRPALSKSFSYPVTTTKQSQTLLENTPAQSEIATPIPQEGTRRGHRRLRSATQTGNTPRYRDVPLGEDSIDEDESMGEAINPEASAGPIKHNRGRRRNSLIVTLKVPARSRSAPPAKSTRSRSSWPTSSSPRKKARHSLGPKATHERHKSDSYTPYKDDDKLMSKRSMTASNRPRSSRGTFLPRKVQTPGEPPVSTPVKAPRTAHTTQNSPISPGAGKKESKNLVSADLAVTDILQSRTRGLKKTLQPTVQSPKTSPNSPSGLSDVIVVNASARLRRSSHPANGTKTSRSTQASDTAEASPARALRSVSRTHSPERDDLARILGPSTLSYKFVGSVLDILRTIPAADLQREILRLARELAGEEDVEETVVDKDMELLNALAAIYCSWKLQREIPVMELNARDIRELRRGAKEFGQWIDRMIELLAPYERPAEPPAEPPVKRKRGRPPGSAKKKRKQEAVHSEAKRASSQANRKNSSVVGDEISRQLLLEAAGAHNRELDETAGSVKEYNIQVPLSVLQTSLLRTFLDRVVDSSYRKEDIAKRIQVLANHPPAFVNQIRHRSERASGSRDPANLDDVDISDSEQLIASPKATNDSISTRRSSRRKSNHANTSSQADNSDDEPAESLRGRPKRSQTRPANWAERLIGEKERFYSVNGNKFEVVAAFLRALGADGVMTAVASRSRETLDCLRNYLRDDPAQAKRGSVDVVVKTAGTFEVLLSGPGAHAGGKGADWSFDTLVVVEEGEVPDSVMEHAVETCRMYRLCTTTATEMEMDPGLREMLGWDNLNDEDADRFEDAVVRKVKETCSCLS